MKGWILGREYVNALCSVLAFYAKYYHQAVHHFKDFVFYKFVG